MEVRIVKDLAKRWGAKNEEFSPQRTQRAQRWGEEGKERQLKVESPDRVGISGPEPPVISDREILVTSD